MGTAQLDAQGRFLRVNDRYSEITGYDRSELLGGMTPLDLDHPDDRAKDDEALRRFLAGAGDYQVEKRYRRKDGQAVWVKVNATLIRDGAGEIASTAAIIEDITDRRLGEERLRVQEALLRTVTDDVRVGLAVVDRDYRYMFVNPAYAEVLGLDSGDIMGKTVPEVLGSVFETQVRPHADRALAGERVRYELRVPKRKLWSGDRYFDVVYEPREAEQSEAGILVIIVDVTARVAAVEQVRASEEHFRLVAHATRDAIWDIDLVTGKVWWNETYDQLFGGRPQDSTESWDWWAERIHQDESAIVVQSLKDAIADPTAEHWAAEYRFRCAGDQERFIQDRAFITRSADGKPIRIVGAMRDQTPQREREQREREILEAQKLESLGVLAGGIAHDFNNLLTAMIGNVGLVREGLPHQTAEHAMLMDVEDAALHAADLCRQMLAYAGQGQFQIKPVDLGGAVREMAQLLKISLSKKATLELKLAESLPPVMADSSQMNQIIMNLLTNASESIGDAEGEVVLATGLMTIGGGDIEAGWFDSDFAPGRYVFVEVRDTGTGMSEETRQRIFEPFFTTKFTGRGLGLAAVQGIVRGHKGALQVRSEVKVGSTFKVLLPVAEGVEMEKLPPEQDTTGSSAPGKGLILVVDDEEPVRRTARRILEHYGYEVLLAVDGEDGIEQFRREMNQLAGVLLDLAMPRLNGEETFRAMHALKPEIPVLLMSGYNEKRAVRRFTGQDLAGFLQKPFNPESLSRKLAAVLAPTKP